jgi:transposase, IS5 family
VEQVVAVTGRPPATVVGDHGFPTAANDQALEALGVKHIGLLAFERTRAFRRLRNWRVGIEARISHLKRAFGLRRLGGARLGQHYTDPRARQDFFRSK